MKFSMMSVMVDDGDMLVGCLVLLSAMACK